MPKPVIIHLKRPIFGPGVLTDRQKFMEKVFTEEVHGKDYKEVAKEWSVTHALNVAHIDGLDEASEKEASVARKRKADTEQ